MILQKWIRMCFIITLIAFEFFRQVNTFDMGIETVLSITSKVTFITFEWFLTVVSCNMLCQCVFLMAFVVT